MSKQLPGSAGPKIFLGWAGWPAGSMAKGKMVVSQGKFGRRRRPTRKKWKNCAPQARPKGEKDKNGAPQARPKGKSAKRARRARFFHQNHVFLPEGPVFDRKTVFWYGFYRFSLCSLMFSWVFYGFLLYRGARSAFFPKTGLLFFVFFPAVLL